MRGNEPKPGTREAVCDRQGVNMANVSDANIHELVDFFRGARRIAAMASTRWGHLEVAILVLSVVTAGSLWGLLSDMWPQETLWVGALLATATTFTSGYSKYTNYHSILGEALTLHSEIGEFLGRVRASPDMPQGEYWPRHKELETKLYNLEVRSGFKWRDETG